MLPPRAGPSGRDDVSFTRGRHTASGPIVPGAGLSGPGCAVRGRPVPVSDRGGCRDRRKARLGELMPHGSGDARPGGLSVRVGAGATRAEGDHCPRGRAAPQPRLVRERPRTAVRPRPVRRTARREPGTHACTAGQAQSLGGLDMPSPLRRPGRFGPDQHVGTIAPSSCTAQGPLVPARVPRTGPGGPDHRDHGPASCAREGWGGTELLNQRVPAAAQHRPSPLPLSGVSCCLPSRPR